MLREGALLVLVGVAIGVLAALGVSRVVATLPFGGSSRDAAAFAGAVGVMAVVASPGRGMFVRTLLHLDATALAFSTDVGGTRTATADLVGLVFNSEGAQVDNISTGLDVTLENRAAEQAIQNGLVYSVRVPIGKPGGYQLRYVVRDRRSGATGSVGGFVNVPDVPGGTFALSGLVLRAGEPTGAIDLIDSDRFSVRPADALGVYAPGTQLSYAYEIYNAGAAVEAVTSLWRGTDRLTSLPPETLVPPTNGAPSPPPAASSSPTICPQADTCCRSPRDPTIRST